MTGMHHLNHSLQFGNLRSTLNIMSLMMDVSKEIGFVGCRMHARGQKRSPCRKMGKINGTVTLMTELRLSGGRPLAIRHAARWHRDSHSLYTSCFYYSQNDTAYYYSCNFNAMSCLCPISHPCMHFSNIVLRSAM
jgi:hypothetical protein